MKSTPLVNAQDPGGTGGGVGWGPGQPPGHAHLDFSAKVPGEEEGMHTSTSVRWCIDTRGWAYHLVLRRARDRVLGPPLITIDGNRTGGPRAVVDSVRDLVAEVLHTAGPPGESSITRVVTTLDNVGRRARGGRDGVAPVEVESEQATRRAVEDWDHVRTMTTRHRREVDAGRGGGSMPGACEATIVMSMHTAPIESDDIILR